MSFFEIFIWPFYGQYFIKAVESPLARQQADVCYDSSIIIYMFKASR